MRARARRAGERRSQSARLALAGEVVLLVQPGVLARRRLEVARKVLEPDDAPAVVVRAHRVEPLVERVVDELLDVGVGAHALRHGPCGMCAPKWTSSTSACERAASSRYRAHTRLDETVGRMCVGESYRRIEARTVVPTSKMRLSIGSMPCFVRSCHPDRYCDCIRAVCNELRGEPVEPAPGLPP